MVTGRRHGINRGLFFKKMKKLRGGLSMALIQQKEKMRMKKKKRVTVKAKALGKGEEMSSK